MIEKIVILYKKNTYVCFSDDIPEDSSENTTYNTLQNKKRNFKQRSQS